MEETEPGSLPFPQTPLDPFWYLQAEYIPTPLKERSGDVAFRVWRFDVPEEKDRKPFAEGTVPIGKRFRVGDHYLAVKEVRFWVAMTVRYEPGKPIVLASLWMGLSGMIITFFGRMFRKKAG